jgi:PAS domain S-box-containing protein
MGLENYQIYKIVTEEGPMAIAVVEKSGKLKYVNQQFADLLGYTVEELQQKTFQEITHPDDLNSDLEMYEKLCNKEITSYSLQKRYYCRRGEIVWANLHVSIASEKDDLALAMVYNISDIKANQSRLEDESLRFASAVDQGLVGLWVWDIQTDDLQWNRSMNVLYGTSYPQFSGKASQSFFPVIHEDDLDEVNRSIQSAIEDKEHFYAEFRIYREDTKEIRYILGNGGVFESPLTGKKYLVGTNIDITRLKKAQEELIASKNELESFAYAISHDLKAPLRGVENLSQWIVEDMGDSLSEDISHKIGLLRDRVGRMQKLIDGLLEFSRIGRTDTLVSSANAGSIIEDSINLYKSNSVKFIVQNDMPVIETNVIRFSQIVSNLVDNAIKHAEANSLQIEIGCDEVDSQYRFYVKDNGKGIDKRHHKSIFDMFTKLSPKDLGGTGAGLALVKRIVEQNDGYTWVESEPGKGACFYWTWPKAKVASDGK